MIITLICIILGGFIANGIRKLKTDTTDDRSDKIIIVVIGAAVGFMVGVIITLTISLAFPYVEEQYELENTKLVALSGVSNGAEGSFFLASGTIGTEQYYKYYYEMADGGKKFGKVSAENATIYEEDRIDAYMTKIGSKRKYSKTVQLLLGFMAQRGCNCERIYAIHVPKGTIKVELKLDLK